jgi:negative regulator of sigma E activity
VSIFASITNLTMKPEEHAWRALQSHASAQLHTGFADRVLRAAHGPQPEAWQQLQARAVAQIRPGFAERVLRAARAVADSPSLASHFALSAVTAAVCLAAVLFVNDRIEQKTDERNLAEWERIVAVADDSDAAML